MGAYLTAPSRQAGGAATATWAVAAKMAKTVASLANMMPECVGVVLEVKGESVLSVWDGGVTEVSRVRLLCDCHVSAAARRRGWSEGACGCWNW